MLDEAQYIQQAHYIFNLDFNFINSDPPTPTDHYPLKLLNKMASDLTAFLSVEEAHLQILSVYVCLTQPKHVTRFV